MVLGLVVVALLTAQPVFEWVDDEGQSHFTNLEATIPDGVQRREFAFSAEPAPIEGAPEEPRRFARADDASGDHCEAALREVETLEAQRDDEQLREEADDERQARDCQAQLNLHGPGAWLSCRASIADPDVATPLQGELEDAYETLRRAQVEGCR